MKITVIGHGYVGLVTAVVFADLGNTVYVIGRNQEKIDQLNRGEPTFYEPGLEEVLKRNLDAGRLHFTRSYADSIPNSEIAFICVGTPSKNNGEADLSSVLTVAESIGRHINKYMVIACKSTVPVGTNRTIKKILIEKLKVSPKKFDIASCPEFLREGTAISDTLNPDRVVVGTESPKAERLLVAFHKPINSKVVLTTIETAEMIKYASNSLLATKISFANMIAFLSEKVGADAEGVLEGVGLDNRIGRRFLYPGVGYGGSCFPKDVKALIKIGEHHGVSMRLLREVEEINEEASRRIVEKILKALKQKSKGKTLALLGLSFKPDTDDMREAASIKILTLLNKQAPHLTIKVYDPIVKHLNDKGNFSVIYSKDAYVAVTGADAMVIVTEWNEFKQLDLDRIKKCMRKPVIIDGRNIFNPNSVKAAGLSYVGVGKV